jgi:hypothetical protein
MHYLHALAELINRLAEGDRIVWAGFVVAVVILGIALAYDVRNIIREARAKKEAARLLGTEDPAIERGRDAGPSCAGGPLKRNGPE